MTVVISLELGQVLIINGIEYKVEYPNNNFVGCNNCDLFQTLEKYEECPIDCGEYVLKTQTQKGKIREAKVYYVTCPYCKEETQVLIKDNVYICNSCNQKFITE